MKHHKLSKFFPLMEGEEFLALVEDIKINGLLEPITVYEDKILDGRNRERACALATLIPKYVTYKGNDPLGYVISLNLRRRHLTVSQRAMLALEMLPEFEKEAKKRKLAGKTSRSGDLRVQARDEVAPIFGVSGSSVQRAKQIKKEAPEKVQAILGGRTTVGEVTVEIRKRKAAKRATEKTKRAERKERQKNPREVKEYLEAIKIYRQALQKAIKVAQAEKFSPEALAFTVRKHKELQKLQEEFKNECA